MKLLSKSLIIFGIIALIFGFNLIYQRQNPSRLEFAEVNQVNISNSEDYPKEISIPSLNLQLGIFPAQITDNNWEVTNKGISHLVMSPSPGERGNSILYGHNYSNLLGSLPKIKPGDEIIINMNSGENKTFIVKFTSVVSPNQTDILKQSDDSRITLYTCTGFLDSKRFVATAILKEDLATSSL